MSRYSSAITSLRRDNFVMKQEKDLMSRYKISSLKHILKIISYETREGLNVTVHHYHPYVLMTVSAVVMKQEKYLGLIEY